MAQISYSDFKAAEARPDLLHIPPTTYSQDLFLNIKTHRLGGRNHAPKFGVAIVFVLSGPKTSHLLNT